MSRSVCFLAALGIALSPTASNAHGQVMSPCQLISNPTHHKIFVQHLKEAGVAIEVDQEGWIEVQKLGRHVLGIESAPAQFTGVSVSARDAEAIPAALAHAGISFEYASVGNGEKVTFRGQSAQNDVAIRLVEKIVD